MKKCEIEITNRSEISVTNRFDEKERINKDEFVSRAINKDYWNQRYAAKEYIWTVTANQFLVAETADLPIGSALELATGEGRNAVWLAEQGWSVCAIDFSEQAIEKAEFLAESKGVLNRVKFKTEDLNKYLPEYDQFDLVTLIYLQLPFENMKSLLQNAVKSLKPGGVFLLIAHDPKNLTHGFGGPQQPELLYTKEQVIDVISDLVFSEAIEIVKAEQVERIVNSYSENKIAFDFLVKAKKL